MKAFFVEGAQPEYVRLPFEKLMLSANWSRPLAVAAVAALAALLHGVLFLWYLNRPTPPPVTEAVALPMIDIALAAPKSDAPAETPPPPKPVSKPPEKKQPKPKKPKVKSEIKKPAVKPDKRPQESPRQTAAPPMPPVQPAPAVRSGDSPQRSAIVSDTPAYADANYLHNPKPVYPRIARQRHWKGRVVLRVLVSAGGRCSELSVYRSSGHDILDEAAMEAVREWQFVPGKHGDTPVASAVHVPIEFTLE